jgi:Tol biopolymer transport system component
MKFDVRRPAAPERVARRRGWHACLAAVATLALGSALALVAPAGEAAFPGTNGKIVFMGSRFGGDYDILSINADGTGLTDLTNNSAFDWYPDVSPDGSKIVFSSDEDGDYEIYSMNADGTGRRQLTHNSVFDAQPAWSPDGTKIVFSRAGNALYTINADGTGEQLIEAGPNAETPEWSPDGTKIVFEANRNDNVDLFVVPATGGSATRLTTDPKRDLLPDWSPDGTRIAFVSDRVCNPYCYSQIWVMNADGSGQTALTSTSPNQNEWPAWSPDGTKIVFSRSNTSGGWDLFTMNADGSNQSLLTTGGTFNTQPDWAPVPSRGEGFVTTSGTQLVLDGQPWRLYGASTYGTSNPGGSQSIAAEISLAKEAGLNTLRLVDMVDERGIDPNAPFEEASWERVDQLLAAMSDAGLHAILDLSAFRNHLQNRELYVKGSAALAAGYPTPAECSDRSGDELDRCVGARWCVVNAALCTDPYSPDDSASWDSFLQFVATRVNTVTGVEYRSDPTIAIVSFAGEPNPPNSGEPLKPTTQELTDFYARVFDEWKSYDPNHLVTSGGLLHIDWEALYGGSSGIDHEAIFSLPNQDVLSIHNYFGRLPATAANDTKTAVVATAAASLGKPWITEEFGFPEQPVDNSTTPATIYTETDRGTWFRTVFDIQRNPPAGVPSAGVAFWNLGPEVAVSSHDVNPGTPATWTAVLGAGAPVDSDNDGVDDAIDTGAGTFDDRGGTFGSIVNVPAGVSVLVEDLSPGGVRITVSGPGSQQAGFSVCGLPGSLKAGSGSVLELTCGSVTVQVVEGAAEYELSDGVVVSMPAGVSARITDAGGGVFGIENLGGGELTVTSGGVSSVVGPGVVTDLVAVLLEHLYAASAPVLKGRSLTSLVSDAQEQYADGKTTPACNTLDEYIDAVRAQRGKKIDPGVADQLIGRAREIQRLMGC